jgi:hypothetical protein
VHVFSPGSPEIERYLLLRDRLRKDAEDRELYARMKRDLASRSWPSMDHYAEAKTEVVEGIIARAADVGGVESVPLPIEGLHKSLDRPAQGLGREWNLTPYDLTTTGRLQGIRAY